MNIKLDNENINVEDNKSIIELFGEDPLIKTTLNKDTIKTEEDAIIEIYKKLRPGELPTVDAARNLFNGLLFDDRRYDLAKVGRFKFYKKLSIANRISGRVAYADIINPETGEVLAEKDSIISAEMAEEIQNSGINSVEIKVNDAPVKVVGNGTVNIHKIITDVDISSLHIKEMVNYEVLKNIMENTDSK